jgi:UDP-glucose 4-epimerase
VFGTDYPTPDGTCVRDYIHVADLAAAHHLVLKALREGKGPFLLNCGYGKGASVKEVLDTYQQVLGKPVAHTTAPRRAGDPPLLVADATKLRTQLGWQPRHDALATIITHAHAWESKLSAQ